MCQVVDKNKTVTGAMINPTRCDQSLIALACLFIRLRIFLESKLIVSMLNRGMFIDGCGKDRVIKETISKSTIGVLFSNANSHRWSNFH